MMRRALCSVMPALALAAPTAWAAPRVVVVPAVVGSSPEPTGDLMSALARGLADQQPWEVVQGAELKPLLAGGPVGFSDEQHAALAAKLAEARTKLNEAAPADAVTALEALQKELQGALRARTLSARDLDLVYRISGTLVAALMAAGQTERAGTLAQETAMLFPGRKPASGDEIPESAHAALGAPVTAGGVKLTISTRPERCEVRVNGMAAGAAPVTIAALPGGVYQASATCPAAAGRSEVRTAPRRIVVGEKETARQELLDGDFEQRFAAEGGQRVRFSSPDERRQLEDGLARRVADRYDADLVVFASVGELSGSDWLNARLYLRSGYLNRQGLVRLEAPRAVALGRYLATGREVPGVLRPEEAGALAAASQAAAEPSAPPKVSPWYTDVVGWCFLGVGMTAVGLGWWQAEKGADSTSTADAIRGDFERQQQLYREAQRQKFWGNIGLIGGGLFAVTGAVLLAVPEYQAGQSELFAVTPLPGGGLLQMSGRY